MLILVVGAVGMVDACVEVVVEDVPSAHDQADDDPDETRAGHDVEAEPGIARSSSKATSAVTPPIASTRRELGRT